jgi:NAD(P)H-hydrate epimerase
MKWVTCDQMRAIDRRAIDQFGIPALILMENAGRGAADEAAKLYRSRSLSGPALIFCGAGNNGGDGFVVARHMANAGFEVRIFCTAARAKIDRQREAGINLTICERMDLPIRDLDTPERVGAIRPELTPGALIVDAVFGVGLASAPREPQATLLRILAESRLPVLAVDVPSGLDADSGKPLGIALPADVTATMACPKVGLGEHAKAFVGSLVVVDIGAPACLLQ